MKNWKEIYEDYKVAVEKKNNKEQIKRMDALVKKTWDKIDHIWDGCFDSLSYGAIVWEKAGFYLNTNDPRNFGRELLSSDIFKIVASKSVYEVMDILSRKMVTGLGTYLMNRYNETSLYEAKRLFMDIEESTKAIDFALVEDVKARYKKEEALRKRIRDIDDAVTRRLRNSDRLYCQMLKLYAEQEFFVVGRQYGYKTIAKLTEKRVVFSDGSWKNKESFSLKWDIEKAFTKEHSEYPRLEA